LFFSQNSSRKQSFELIPTDRRLENKIFETTDFLSGGSSNKKEILFSLWPKNETGFEKDVQTIVNFVRTKSGFGDISEEPIRAR